ncbi:MAG: nucleoside kinase [Bacteroidales bacterium]|jgi:uridine kinase|nr:nucleoside kinase [Bacteroidales bacterium]
MITVHIQNTNKTLTIPFGMTVQELAKQENIRLEYPVMGALINNKVRECAYRIHKPCTVQFFDMTSSYGHLMYTRSVYFILYKAVKETLPKHVRLKILHSISGGKYCELDNLDQALDHALVSRLYKRMREIVESNIPFERMELPSKEAVQLFKDEGLEDKYELLRNRTRIYTSIYKLGDTVNYYFGNLAPSTGVIHLFGLELYESGLLLKVPQPQHPTTLSHTHQVPKLFSVYQDYKKWANTIGIPYVYNVNKKIAEGNIQDTILITEAYHEKLLAKIADQIHERQSKVVLISGPSSSGKTTTCKRLSVQLGILGYDPVQISVDDFFVEREETPKDENGEYDFESVDAIDLKLFNDTLNRLLQGEEVPLPTFDFSAGKKLWKGNTIQLRPNSILVIEGIHCLNPRLTEQIDDSIKFKLFVSALTCISIDRQNPIPTTDNRLIRRIIRDYNYRGYSAQQTISRWPSVRRGENRNIFPFQENADAMFNTSLICEMGVLKKYAIPILLAVPENSVEFAEAYRLLKFLSYFKVIQEENIPGTSILREFVGGSKFKY